MITTTAPRPGVRAHVCAALPIALAALGVTLQPQPAHAAFVFDDIAFWVGAPDTPGAQRAALVIDWDDGSSPSSFAWGYLWPAGETRTGYDMAAAVASADPRLTIGGLETGFLENISFDPDGQGPLALFRPGFNSDTGEFWNYYVNNEVEPGNFTPSSHLLPPNGPPFATGAWNSSNTGVADRPLADGSWDGFIYTTFLGPQPGEPVAAPPIPEPEPLLACLATAWAVLLVHRRRPQTPVRTAR